MNGDIFHYVIVKPFKALGLTSAFWDVHINILIYTWIAMISVFALIMIGRRALRGETNKITICYELVLGFFINLCDESFGRPHFRFFAFTTSVFFFTTTNCLVGLLPFCKEATEDLNTTLALGLTCFIYVQYQKVAMHGLREYAKEFFQPFFVMAPINIVGELAKIASMSFRLFGNIIGGGIIFSMLVAFVESYRWPFLIYTLCAVAIALAARHIKHRHSELLSLLATVGSFILFFLAWAQMFFGIFEGLIQSFVITMLTVTYLSMSMPSSELISENQPS